MEFHSYQEAKAAFAEDAAMLEAHGIYLQGVDSYTVADWKRDASLAMDAQPALATTTSGGLPGLLTTSIDPTVTRVLFTPNKAAKIVGEKRAGDWTDETRIFPVIEHTGEVTSYSDYATGGSADVNTNWPQRQSYLFQTIKQLGDREIERAGRGKINLVAEKDLAAVTALNKFANLTYFFGVSGLQNYGLLNDPSLPASITPATKAYGQKPWIYQGSVQATANEVYLDIQNLFNQLVIQTGGLVEAEDKLVLASSPSIAVALKATNSFGVNVYDLLKDNFPNIRFETAVQYGVSSSTNTQGIAAGNLIQLIAETIEGQETAFVAFNEKLRAHKIVLDLSAWKQKMTAGTWGAIIRQPFAIASMLGV